MKRFHATLFECGRVLVVGRRGETSGSRPCGRLLKKNGYEVEVADSGEAALALVDSFGPES